MFFMKERTTLDNPQSYEKKIGWYNSQHVHVAHGAQRHERIAHEATNVADAADISKDTGSWIRFALDTSKNILHPRPNVLGLVNFQSACTIVILSVFILGMGVQEQNRV